MKRLLFAAFLLVIAVMPLHFVSAQGMMRSQTYSVDSAAILSQQQEELEGKVFLDDLISQKITCSQLTDSDFEKIGEYFMGQSIGDTSRHIAMNTMMKRMMGEKGEEQAHAAMGKRVSNCDPNAQFPQNMMNGGLMGSMMGGNGWGMMGGFGTTTNSSWSLGNVFGFLVLLGLIVVLVLLIIWLFSKINWKSRDNSPLEILKRRFAKGDLSRKEFESMKKELGG